MSEENAGGESADVDVNTEGGDATVNAPSTDPAPAEDAPESDAPASDE